MTALADHLWQSSLFALAAGLLTLALRRNAARIRFWLWFAASLKFLVPFTALVFLGDDWRGYAGAAAVLAARARRRRRKNSPRRRRRWPRPWRGLCVCPCCWSGWPALA